MQMNNKTHAALLILTLALAGPSFAAGLAEQLAACRAIESCAERMACYDAIAVDDSAGMTAPLPPAAPAPAAKPAPAPSAEELFGKSAEAAQRSIAESAGAAPVDQLEATVTEVRDIAYDRVLVTLDNGQRWRQTARSSLRLSEGDAIVIKAASLGSYKLAKADGKRTMRVERVD